MRGPLISMLPDQVSTQNLPPTATRSARPSPFDAMVGYDVRPEGLKLSKGPRNAEYLCQVEWAWSPMHGRIDEYYLSRGRTHWLLWLHHEDDFEGKWVWLPIGNVPRKQANFQEAATHLLIEFWQFDRSESEVDRFHRINEAGALSTAVFETIARESWPS